MTTDTNHNDETTPIQVTDTETGETRTQHFPATLITKIRHSLRNPHKGTPRHRRDAKAARSRAMNQAAQTSPTYTQQANQIGPYDMHITQR